MRKRSIGTLLAAIMMVVGFAAGTNYAFAQDAGTPESEVSVAHPAHIHSGTCEELGDVVYPLEDVTDAPLQGTQVASPEPKEEGLPGDVIGRSTTVVDASLEDILAEEHAVNVHESAENIDVYVACGNVEAEPADGELIIDLMQLNDSGINGQAILSDLGDGTTEVTITLTDAAAEGFASPEATPAA